MAERSLDMDEYEQLTHLRGLLVFLSPFLLLVGALLCGGASRLNPIGLMVAEGLGVLALAPALLRFPDLVYSRLTLAACVLLGLAAGLVLLQLAPLPPALLSALPGRQPLATAVTLVGLPNHWRPMTLAPDETRGAALFLLAPAGMFLASLQCDVRERWWLLAAALCVALISLPLSALQMAGVAGGPLQLHAAATIGTPNGFFANHNHQAAFMLAAVGLSAALSCWDKLPSALARRPIAILGLMLAFAVAAAATLSFAGLVLIGPVLVVALFIMRGRLTGSRQWMRLLIPIAAAIGVGALVVVLSDGTVIDRAHDFNMGAFGQISALPNVVAAGHSLQPLGSGIGAFDMVYRSVEPLNLVSPEYLNHVHDDYVELWLEGGWPAVALILGAVVWWGLGSYAAWFGAPRADTALARAGSLVATTLLLQSVVDYPLRTPALAVMFALACALMLPTPRLKRD